MEGKAKTLDPRLKMSRMTKKGKAVMPKEGTTIVVPSFPGYPRLGFLTENDQIMTLNRFLLTLFIFVSAFRLFLSFFVPAKIKV